MTPRRVLVAVIGLLLVTELALSPFYPQLLEELYDVDDPGTVGLLLWACRAAALASLPLLGLLARRIGLVQVVTGGLIACAVLDATLVVAPSVAAFVATSAAAAAAGSALLLAYPALVALDEDGGPGVMAFVALFHGATVLATGFGAAIVGLPDPRVGLALFVVVDLVLLVLVLRALPRVPVRPPSASRERGRLGAAAAVATVAIVFELGANVVRPFFTSYALESGRSLATAAALFLLPSLAALAVLPAARATRRMLGDTLLPVALVTAALGLALQAALPDTATLASGRVLLGAGLGLAHVEIDRAMFAAVGTDGAGYAALETVRGVSLAFAPLLAASLAASTTALPLAAGAAFFALAAILAVALVLTVAPKESHVPSR